MAVRNAQRVEKPESPFRGTVATDGEVRTHRTGLSRRAHRAAHQAAMQQRRRWMALGAVGLLAPFGVAIAILELVH